MSESAELTVRYRGNSGSIIELAPDVFAWVASTATWGMSNAGLVRGAAGSLLIDTLMDPVLTQAMVSALREHADSGTLELLLNTHSDGDHWFGNQVVEGAEMWSTDVAAAEMTKPSAGTAWMDYMLGLDDELGDFGRGAFGGFDLSSIVLTPPTRTFVGSARHEVGGHEVEFIDFGTSHSPGDSAAWLPEQRVVFAGDLLFFGSTPVVWSGSLTNVFGALDRLEALGAKHYVPGHGAVGTLEELQQVRDYYEWIFDKALGLIREGVPYEEALQRIDLGAFSSWAEVERIAPNLATIYREHAPANPIDREYTLRAMMKWKPAAGATGHGDCAALH